MKWGKALAVWAIIIAAESVSGTIRQLWIAPAVGERPAHQTGVLAGVILILLIAWLTARWLDAKTLRAQLQIGALWVVSTVVFEFSLGIALGLSWTRMLSDYELAQGGLMGLGLAFMLVSPWLGAILRGMRAHRGSAARGATNSPKTGP